MLGTFAQATGPCLARRVNGPTPGRLSRRRPASLALTTFALGWSALSRRQT
ncbi:hypothetical protein I545_6941 [Mycobacterium kansasii 662]|uniref:Uncharacterized protein n=1 Tax=Mycobacterium kansasii 662 TaxID=1299326 RepID=X7XNZ5_MYCKA|nr:hypothetical protein I545_6941 [Mycobacterium kansasii 662]